MHKNTLEFSVYQILIGNFAPQTDSFDVIKDSDLIKSSIEDGEGQDEVQSIEKIEKQVSENRFVTLYFEDGNRYPYSDKVIRAENLQEVDNPRAPEEIEMDGQFFVLIDILKSRLYISDLRRKNRLNKWLEEQLNKPVIVKPLLTDKDFVASIKDLQEITFSVEPTLLNSSGQQVLAAELVRDLLGFEGEEASVTIRYKKRTKITDVISNKINGIVERRNEFKNITIVGRTSDKFESIFNLETVINKLPILVTPDLHTKKLDKGEVFTTLMGEIRDD